MRLTWTETELEARNNCSASLLQRSRLLSLLSKKKTIDLQNPTDLFRLSKRLTKELLALDFGQLEIDEIRSFHSIATLFPPQVALALHDRGVTKLDNLLPLKPDEMTGALAAARVDPEDIAVEIERLKEWQSRARSEPMLNGLTLDLG